MTTKKTLLKSTKKGLATMLGGLRAKMRKVSGKVRMTDLGGILTNIEAAGIHIAKIQERLAAGDFDGKMAEDQIGRLKANLEEMILYLSDFKHQVETLFEEMGNCIGNVKALDDMIGILGGRRVMGKKKTVKKRKNDFDDDCFPSLLDDFEGIEDLLKKDDYRYKKEYQKELEKVKATIKNKKSDIDW